jgi:hypothetical protein
LNQSQPDSDTSILLNAVTDETTRTDTFVSGGTPVQMSSALSQAAQLEQKPNITAIGTTPTFADTQSQTFISKLISQLPPKLQ